MVSLTYRTQDLVKIDNESFELQHIFKCDRNILVLPHQFTKSALGKVKSLTSVRQWDKHMKTADGNTSMWQSVTHGYNVNKCGVINKIPRPCKW